MTDSCAVELDWEEKILELDSSFKSLIYSCDKMIVFQAQMDNFEKDMKFLEQNSKSDNLIHYLSWHIACIFYLIDECKLILFGDKLPATNSSQKMGNTENLNITLNINNLELECNALLHKLLEDKLKLPILLYDKTHDRIRRFEDLLTSHKLKINDFANLLREKLFDNENNTWKMSHQNAMFAVIEKNSSKGLKSTILVEKDEFGTVSVLCDELNSEEAWNSYPKLKIQHYFERCRISDPKNNLGLTKKLLVQMYEAEMNEIYKIHSQTVNQATLTRNENLLQLSADCCRIHSYPSEKVSYLQEVSLTGIRHDHDTKRKSIATAFCRSTSQKRHVREEESQDWKQDPEYIVLVKELNRTNSFVVSGTDSSGTDSSCIKLEDQDAEWNSDCDI